MKIHELKIHPKYYNAVNEEIKTFEIRENDRNYKVGDVLILREFTPEKQYTGNYVYVIVRYITDYAQKENFIVMSIELVPIAFTKYIYMTDIDKKIFQALITHKHLYGIAHMGRDGINAYWEIMNSLLEKCDISDNDEQWLMEYWSGE
nr:MAG TPA: activating signal cointegrator [Caudoviricetes sp.]